MSRSERFHHRMLSLGGRLTKKCFCILKNRGLPLDWQSDKTTCECAELSVYSTPANSKTSRDGASVASYVAYCCKCAYYVSRTAQQTRLAQRKTTHTRTNTHTTHTRVTSRPRPLYTHIQARTNTCTTRTSLSKNILRHLNGVHDVNQG